MIEDEYVLSALLERQGRGLGLKRRECTLAGVPRVVASRGTRTDEVGVDKDALPPSTSSRRSQTTEGSLRNT